MGKKFDPDAYRRTAYQEWQNIAGGWHRWTPVISNWSLAVTEQMLDLAQISADQSVLDIAAGDGDQSLMAARRVGSSGRVLATDISSNLLSYVAAAAQEEGLTNLDTQVMDAEALDLEDESFDAAISRLGLMLIADVNKAMSEIHRVLKKKGRVSAIVFSTPDKNPWLSIPAMIVFKHVRVPAPQPGTPGLFSLGQPGHFEKVLRQAGFQDIEAYRVMTPLHMESAAKCAEMVRGTAGVIRTLLSPLEEAQKEAIWTEIEKALGQLEGENGFESPSEVVVVAGTKV
ncbi:MAG: class I SAM-dependent methyltransferase [Candidatus Promineifilaceae bacterium]